MNPSSALTVDDRLRRAPARLRLLSDERLVVRIRAGDERAFDVLFERHHPGVLSFCRYLLGSRDEAEDAVQQAFLRLHGALLRDRPPAELRPFLYAIARNRCRSMLAERRHDAPVGDEVPDVAGLADEVQQRADLQELVADIGRLPEDQRAALVLAELGDLSHGGIAEVLDVPEARVRTLIYQAKAHLLAEREARERSCFDVRAELATASGAALRRSHLRRHLRSCPGCRKFKSGLARQHAALGLVLPVTASAALKGSIGGGGGAAVAAAATGAAGAGTGAGGGLLGGLGAVKAAAVVAALGAGAAGGTAAVDALRDAPAPAPRTAAAAGAAPASPAVGRPQPSAQPAAQAQRSSSPAARGPDQPAARRARQGRGGSAPPPAAAPGEQRAEREEAKARKREAKAQRTTAKRETKAQEKAAKRQRNVQKKAVVRERKAPRTEVRDERKGRREAAKDARTTPVTPDSTTTTTTPDPVAERTPKERRRANSTLEPTSVPLEGGTP
ncbi:MAG TPA: sigma-70 family RNA polymerase sigma factor [Baekduia sp.]|nr:sigma-70 family RNA polymerase sigma factor [Baekduia sp.]